LAQNDLALPKPVDTPKRRDSAPALFSKRGCAAMPVAVTIIVTDAPPPNKTRFCGR